MATHVPNQIVRQINEKTRDTVASMLAGDAKAVLAALDAGGGSSPPTPSAPRCCARAGSATRP